MRLLTFFRARSFYIIRRFCLSKMYIVIAYDISENKRRERLRKALRSFGRAVQKSVFECDLSQKQIIKMVKVVRGIILREDNVRIYRICGGCAKLVEVFGGREIETNKNAYIM